MPLRTREVQCHSAHHLRKNDKSTIFKNIPPEEAARNLAHYNSVFVLPKGKLIIAIESGRWSIQSAPLILMDDQKGNIIGKNLLSLSVIKLIQEKSKQ